MQNKIKMLGYLIIAIIIFAAIFIVLNGCSILITNNNKDMKTTNNQIFAKGDKVSDNFIGTAYVKMLVADSNNIFDTQVYNVTFEPGCRNNWHSHPGGQLLLVTAGTGYYQEKGKPARLLRVGDVVEIKPDVVHWHGATPNSEFTHIGITSQVSKGDAVWLDSVSDEEYNKLPK